MMPISPRILIVEEDDDVRDLLERALVRVLPQAEIHGCWSFPAALELLRDDCNFDLVISESNHLGMDGGRLARALLELRRLIPVLICSWDPPEERERLMRFPNIVRFLPKPVLPQAIGDAVFEALAIAPACRTEAAAG